MIRRVLVLPLNYDHPQSGLVEAFRRVFNPDEVAVYDYLERQRQGRATAEINAGFRVAVAAYKPDWVWMQLQDTGVITPDTLRIAREQFPQTLFTHWTGDFRPTISEYLAAISREAHMTLISSKGQLRDFFRVGANDVMYCQIGLDWTEDVLGLPEWTPPFRVPDVVFIGNYYAHGPWAKGTQERLNAVRALQASGVDFGVVGAGWPEGTPVVGQCTVKQQHHVWKRAKVGVNVNHTNDVECYYSDRLLIGMASGIPMVTRAVPGLRAEFVDGADCVFFETEDELVSSVRRLLNNPSSARILGRCGRLVAMQHHSWQSRLLDILPEIEERFSALQS